MTNGNTSTHGKTRKYSGPSTSLPKFQAKTHLKHLSKLDKVNTLTLWTGNNNTKKKKKVWNPQNEEWDDHNTI